MLSIDCLAKQFGHFTIVAYDTQNKEYEGMVLRIVDSNQLVRSRLAKKTPKKSGYFTVFWEKDTQHSNHPFHEKNFPDFLAVVVVDALQQGIFLIPRKVAAEKKIVTSARGQGKMALRFYPPWCTNLNKTARATQKWQTNYFIDLTNRKNQQDG